MGGTSTITYRRRGMFEFDLLNVDGRLLAAVRKLRRGAVSRFLAESRLSFVVEVSQGLFLPEAPAPSMTLLRARMRQRALVLDAARDPRFLFRGVFTLRQRAFLIADPLSARLLGRIILQPEIGPAHTLVLEDASGEPFARVEHTGWSRERYPAELALPLQTKVFTLRRSGVADARLAEASLWAVPAMATFDWGRF
jgi:hypothetical protein